MGKINCHTHTRCSDGADDVLEMAHEAKRLGHSALVITDHDSYNDSNHPSVVEVVSMLERMKLLPLPVIVGAEIRTPFCEFLLFGKDVLRNWDNEKHRLNLIQRHFDLDLWVDVFERYVLHKVTYSGLGVRMRAIKFVPYPYAMIVCHPWFEKGFVDDQPPRLWQLCHGFEIQNGLRDLEATHWYTIEHLRKIIPGGMELHNSDAHSVSQLSECHNETPHEIADEAQLIKWLRSGCKNYRINRPKPDLDRLILEEHMRGIEFAQKMMEGMQPCPPEYMKVLNENMEDLLE